MDYKKEIIELEEKIKEEEKRLYFIKQRTIGQIALLIGMIGCFFIGPLSLLFFFPIGIILIFTKKMVWMNKWYFENGGPEQWEEERWL